MTLDHAIERAALRKRTGHRDEYEAIHAALVAELGWAEEVQASPPLTVWQRIKRWLA